MSEQPRRPLLDELADASAAVDDWDDATKALRELSLRAEAWFAERYERHDD